MKQSSLSAGLKAAAGRPIPAVDSPVSLPPVEAKRKTGASATPTVLIGGHFAPEVRRTLLLVQAEQKNSGKNLKQLLGEAINDLCAKYGKPQPYQGDI